VWPKSETSDFGWRVAAVRGRVGASIPDLISLFCDYSDATCIARVPHPPPSGRHPPLSGEGWSSAGTANQMRLPWRTPEFWRRKPRQLCPASIRPRFALVGCCNKRTELRHQRSWRKKIEYSFRDALRLRARGAIAKNGPSISRLLHTNKFGVTGSLVGRQSQRHAWTLLMSSRLNARRVEAVCRADYVNCDLRNEIHSARYCPQILTTDCRDVAAASFRQIGP
jgi:hypothetical protein